MITNYDKDLINDILLPFNINPFLGSYKSKKNFWGYKQKDDLYYSFFFSLYKKEVLLLTFRLDQSNISKTRVYVKYDNIEIIRLIIKSILNSETLDISIYEKYIYKEKEITDEEKLELNEMFFKIDENDYIKNRRENEDLIEYRLKGKKIINKAFEIIKTSSLKDREKDIYIKYNNIDDTSKSITLQELGDYYEITGERVRQLLRKSQRKLRRYKYELIPLLNEIVGEKQYSYLIEGIIKQKNYKVMKTILLLVLSENDFNKIKHTLYKCIMLNKDVALKEISERKNIGSLWELKEEQQLIEEFIMGISIKDIAEIHKRTPEGIRKRLIRLKLINAKEVPRFYE